jgi:hypothetical protein
MDKIYLLAICERTSPHPDSMKRIGKCWPEKGTWQEIDGLKVLVGYWYRIFVYNNPVNSMLDVFFVGLDDDPGVRAAAVLAERLEGGLNRGRQQWKAHCGPIDEDDAVQIRIELEVV